jgi:hypothetical protein
MKKLVLLSILAASVVAVPAVQAQMWRGQRLQNRGAAMERRGAWFGNHGFPRQAARLDRRGQRFEHRGERAEYRNYYHPSRRREWAQRPNQRFGPPRGWAQNNSRAPYQARAYGHYRPPYGPANYGPGRPGFSRAPQAPYGPGGRPYANPGPPPNAWGSRSWSHNNAATPPSRPSGSVTPITYTPPAGSAPHGSGTWASSRTPGSSAPSPWGNHYNSGAPSGTTHLGSGGSTTVTSN